ncbi:MAG TPA: glycosyltransferase family 4 protein [Bryobacteraceae bacterium]|nr:glycosyltransferase family 4 protein [Bryobacteraceae bacterium]
MKVVVVHRGARDNYQVARGLHDGGMLEALVTDLYWPAEQSWAGAFERIAPARVSGALRARYAETLPASSVVSCRTSGLSSLAISKVKSLPFDWQRDSMRWCDRQLGTHAGKLATARDAALLSYSYYGHSAFSSYSGKHPRILFQLHPHPARVRTILRRERMEHPECASSLDKEWELALPEEDFTRLAQEAQMAEHWLVASSFTKETLVETGIPGERIGVIPYGIDLQGFVPRKGKRNNAKLQLLFVGTIGQRKGIKYLIEAMEALPKDAVELTVCGRAVDDLALFKQSKAAIRIFPSISAQGLREMYQSSDIFVFPSLAEGFAQVLLEAMASGLAIISTTRTAARDLVRQGKEGLVIEPGDAAGLAGAIEHFLQRPDDVEAMGQAARRRAEYFTWDRFRTNVAEAVGQILQQEQPAGAGRYV